MLFEEFGTGGLEERSAATATATATGRTMRPCAIRKSAPFTYLPLPTYKPPPAVAVSSSTPSTPPTSQLSSPAAEGSSSHGEGTHGAARQALRPGHHPRVQEVEVEPVREHVARADRGRQHQGGRGVVRREAHGVRVQGQDQEQRHPLPLHLGQDHPPARKLRRRPRPVQVQPPSGIHGAQGQGVHVPEQHLRFC